MEDDCFASLWPVGHREGLNNTLLDFSAKYWGREWLCLVFVACRPQGGALMIFYWTFSAKQLGRDMVVSCLCGLSATGRD